MAKQTLYEIAFSLISWQEQQEWRDKALEKYDNVMLCPVCRGLLTGLHERSAHFQKYLNKRAAKMWEKAVKLLEKR